MMRAHGAVDLLLGLRRHALREHGHHLLPYLRFLRRALQQFFSGTLVESNGMQFIPGHVPPARQNGAGQKAGNKFSPDQRLNILGRDEILLHLGEDVRKISERSHKMSTAARRRTFSEKLRAPARESSCRPRSRQRSRESEQTADCCAAPAHPEARNTRSSGPRAYRARTTRAGREPLPLGGVMRDL